VKPGFTGATGGLLREPDLVRRQAQFDRAAWLRAHGVELAHGTRLVSLFCYEPAGLAQCLAQLAAGPGPARLLVTAGRATAAVRALCAEQLVAGSSLAITYLPLLTQADFDHLLWSCDLNFVRGEDSLVRALWAGRPFVWQLYPQDDDAQHAKLAAFLDWLQAPASWRDFHRWWNGDAPADAPLCPAEWAACAEAARGRLLLQADLVTQLRQFVTRAGP
jgi:uncharacterized repeat protein (TIGR03837 family)